MRSLPVVEEFDVLKDITSGLLAGMVMTMMRILDTALRQVYGINSSPVPPYDPPDQAPSARRSIARSSPSNPRANML